MIIARHKEGGIYCVYYTGKMKMDDGRWEECVVYQRLAISLKRDEKTDETYIRTKENFRENFELVLWSDFYVEYPNFDMPEFKNGFSGIFK